MVWQNLVVLAGELVLTVALLVVMEAVQFLVVLAVVVVVE
jgi:hypothetical protein